MKTPNKAPNFELLQSFFHTLALEHKGILGPYLSLSSLDVYATRLATAGRQKYGWDISQSLIGEVKDVS